MKRFTETTKWDKDWYISLPVKHKCLWQFLCDRCDCAGVWEPNFKLATYLVGEPIEVKDLHQMSGRVMKLECGKYLIVPFVAFQHGMLSVDCPTHVPVIRSIEKHLTIEEMERVSIGYHKAVQSLKVKNKGKGKAETLEGGAGETATTPEFAVPTVAEVMAFGSMGANIPADFCRHYHESKEIKVTWFNGYGRLVDWKKEIVKWWAGSAATWGRDKGQSERGKVGANEIKQTLRAKRI